MPVPLRAKDMPYPMQDRTWKVYDYFLETAIQMPKSAGIIVNTVETLEKTALNAILDGQCTPGEPAPRIYCIGPLIVSSDGSRSGENRHDCLNWLDMQPKGSVVFLSFGSLGKFSASQLKEMALGLEKSGVRGSWREQEIEDTLQNLGSSTESRVCRWICESLWVELGSRSDPCRGANVGLASLCRQKLYKVSVVEELKVALAVEAEDYGLVSVEELEKLVS
ncbi:hypothetical protein Patl1_01204 [Pistacia atlantica]|uniref:Uncharacterized protein n=1 Tax=Pistacia atlantica TaxID=434234 RepID=A0ACC1CBM7_9ROSI|nr:hypothetical protein Patl1_01204 [Pistacia atlantica]